MKRTSLLWACLSLLLQVHAVAAGSDDPELLRVREMLDAATGREGGFEYSANRFVDYVEGDSILLQGHAVVLHRGARLEADEMVYHRDRRVVVARASLDSSGLPIGVPKLSRGEDVLVGERILYDTDSGEGIIRNGRIGHEDGFYAGKRISTRSESEFHVRSGSYTTCDYDHPHFDFYSPRIKVLVGDMAIARPVYFRIAEHRLFYVPFYVFSLREDRQSGILTPGFGRRAVSFGSDISEWEVRDIGYYLAPSQYWDATLSADLRQRSGWLTRAALNYAWRYHFNGRLDTRIQNSEVGDRTSWSWAVSGNHREFPDHRRRLWRISFSTISDATHKLRAAALGSIDNSSKGGDKSERWHFYPFWEQWHLSGIRAHLLRGAGHQCPCYSRSPGIPISSSTSPTSRRILVAQPSTVASGISYPGASEG